MSAYIIGDLTIHDRDEYGKYETGFMDILLAHQGELLSVDEAPEVLEGDWNATRSVILKFADADAAKRWFNSDDYQAIAQHRRAASLGNIRLTAGLDLG